MASPSLAIEEASVNSASAITSEQVRTVMERLGDRKFSEVAKVPRTSGFGPGPLGTLRR
jgi:hypothetical protein